MKKQRSIEGNNGIPLLEAGHPANAGIFSALIRQTLLYQVTTNVTPLAARVDINQPIYRLTDTQEQPSESEIMVHNLLQKESNPLGLATSFMETNQGEIEDIITTPDMPKCMLMVAGFRIGNFPNSTNSLALKAPSKMRVFANNGIQMLELPKVTKRRSENILMPLVEQVVCRHCPFRLNNSCLPTAVITKSEYSFDKLGKIALKVPYSQFYNYAP